MLDEQHSPAVPSIPETTVPGTQNATGARTTSPDGGSVHYRPEVRGMQALAHVFAAWPTLPALECTVLPHGAVTAQIPVGCTGIEAEATMRAWCDALMRDPGSMCREIERHQGPWQWFEVTAELSVNPAKPGAQRFPFTLKGRAYALARPLVPRVA
jgi:hypothetical protein